MDGCEKLSEYVSFPGEKIVCFFFENKKYLCSLGEQELSRSLILIIDLFESVSVNSQQILQTDKSSAFTFCQTPIERIITDTNTKDFFPNLMK